MVSTVSISLVTGAVIEAHNSVLSLLSRPGSMGIQRGTSLFSSDSIQNADGQYHITRHDTHKVYTIECCKSALKYDAIL